MVVFESLMKNNQKKIKLKAEKPELISYFTAIITFFKFSFIMNWLKYHFALSRRDASCRSRRWHILFLLGTASSGVAHGPQVYTVVLLKVIFKTHVMGE